MKIEFNKSLKFLLLIIPVFGYAQIYYPLVKEKGEWINSTQSSVNHVIDHLYISGDTIINNISYLKLYVTNRDSIIDPTSLIYMGAIREDSNKQVFYWRFVGFRFQYCSAQETLAFWRRCFNRNGDNTNRLCSCFPPL